MKLINVIKSYLVIFLSVGMILFTLMGCSEDEGKEKYQVVFNSLGGSAVATQQIFSGAKAVAPADPIKQGFGFGGWFADVGLTDQWNFAINTVSSNTTLYAKWGANQYTVVFDSQGGSTVSPQLVAYTNKITLPTPPQKSGYGFGGWYVDTALSMGWDFSSHTVTSNTTLYAKWNSYTAAVLYTDMVDVPGGRWQQRHIHGHSFTNIISSFKIGKYEVTYHLWYTVYTWATNNGYDIQSPGQEGHNGVVGAEPTTAKYKPATMVNWRDAIVWCNAYSELSGLGLVYFNDPTFQTPIKTSHDSGIVLVPGNVDMPYVNWDATGYRLPTEGEWMYAASYRDGVQWTPPDYAPGASANYTVDAANLQVAWFSENSFAVPTTHPNYGAHIVGTKLPTQLQLYDMGGNVHEWCWDWHGDWPALTTQSNYRGVSSGGNRVMLGGSWEYFASTMQVGCNLVPKHPKSKWRAFGFRVAQSLTNN